MNVISIFMPFCCSERQTDPEADGFSRYAANGARWRTK
uniref:Uncharacterized protein n=1 Tax=Anopheles quadriannulatus TaxID=34691 RepID=A0A182XQP6_ANOQN